MKKTILFLALSSVVFLNACKKSTVTATIDPPITNAQFVLTAQNMSNIEGVKGLPNQDLKKIAFRMLSPIEKYGAWVENVRLISTNFTPQQKLLVAEFVNFLSPEVFDKPNNGQIASFSYNWLNKATKVYTSDQIKAIAFQLFSTTDAKSTIQINFEDGGGGPSKNCNCASGSWWSCGGDSSCPPSSNMIECKNPSSSGCGFGWVSPCDNLCVYGNGTTDPPIN